MKSIWYTILIAFPFMITSAAAQVPEGTPVSADYFRTLQLSGKADPNISFGVFPGIFAAPDSLARDRKAWNDDREYKILPVIFKQQYNTDHSYGWNDGAMVPSKGYQVLLSAGLSARYGPLSVRLQPEAVWAQNAKFDDFPVAYDNFIRDKYTNFYNIIDLPDRFGESSYQQISWGQSNIRLTFDPVSLGLSNENLWWGPGIRNSLMMSNTAPGFKHITLNTTRPVKTPVGSFEGQIIAGRLEQSGFNPPGTGILPYTPKDKDWRYLSGIILSYHPKWIPGLFFGFSRSFYLYHNELGTSLGDYFPLLLPFTRTAADQQDGVAEDFKKRDQLISVFARWLWVDAKTELYLEFGKNDHSETQRDFLLEPEHARAYIAGFRKLIDLRKRDQQIQLSLEVTHLENPNTHFVREGGDWYSHYQVRDGYTNNGQYLGAGIGSGSNLTSADISWVNGVKKLGLQLEFYEHNHNNRDFDELSRRRQWLDFSIGAHSGWNYRKLFFTADLKLIRSRDYQWQLGKNAVNVAGQLGTYYNF